MYGMCYTYSLTHSWNVLFYLFKLQVYKISDENDLRAFFMTDSGLEIISGIGFKGNPSKARLRDKDNVLL